MDLAFGITPSVIEFLVFLGGFVSRWKILEVIDRMGRRLLLSPFLAAS